MQTLARNIRILCGYLGYTKPMLRHVLALCLLVLMLATAQTPSGSLLEVRVVGASESIANLVRINLNARPGTDVERIDLEAERNRVLALGTFASVSLSIEDRGNGPILFVNVQENPPIEAIRIAGSRFAEERLLEILDEVNLLRPGAIFNSLRAQEAIETLRRGYREAGWPFDVPIELDVTPVTLEDAEGSPDAPVILTYRIQEEVPLEDVRFEGLTVLGADRVREAFAPLSRLDSFDFNLFEAARRGIAQAYEAEGFRGSGVDNEATELIDGVLVVRLRELVIASIDATAIGVDPSALSLQPGDLFNFDALLEDVRRLAQGRSSDIRLDTLSTAAGEVRVVFRAGPPESAGPVEAVVIEGNTVFSDEELQALFQLRVSDTFSSELAREDFRRIQVKYRDAGFLLVNQSDFSYSDGVYIQRLREVTIADYGVVFEDGEGRTRTSVITRYMPPRGSVYQEGRIRNSLLTLARLGVVEPFDLRLAFPDGESSGVATANIFVRENPSRVFTPQANYATDTGFSASLGYSDNNFLGLAHRLSVNVDGRTSDLGLQFGGNVTYSIPWLYLDFLDFRETPTSIALSLFSDVNVNQAITFDGSRRINHPCVAAGTCEDIPENDVFIGDFSRRDTGARFSIGRPILPNTAVRLNARGSYSSYRLEPPNRDCSFDEDGNIEDRNCSLDEDDAERFVPQSGVSSFISAELTFDNRDNPEFPTEGFRAISRFGIGFGSDYRDPISLEQRNYSYQQVELGGRTYFSLPNPSHVFAARLDFGHQFGRDYPSSRFFAVGNTVNEATQIRGYNRDDLSPSRTYLIGSVEYRYDFGLATPITQTLVGIVFADAGYVSSVPGFDEYATPLLVSAGLGVQINIGFGGGVLAPLRLDYGFSPENPSGVLSFRLGYVF